MESRILSNFTDSVPKQNGNIVLWPYFNKLITRNKMNCDVLGDKLF